MKKYILYAVLLFCLVPVYGREGKIREPFVLRKHEFALSGAIYPGRYAFGYDFDFLQQSTYSYSEPSSISSIYRNAETYNKERISNSWAFSYTYNFTRVFALQAAMAYEGGWSETYLREDDTMISSISSQYLTPMLTARFSWMNRKYVRMYSSVGAGLSISLSKTHFVIDDDTVRQRPDSYLSLQVTPVGISVGGKLFGFVEVGIGTIYVGGCFGIGYRF